MFKKKPAAKPHVCPIPKIPTIEQIAACLKAHGYGGERFTSQGAILCCFCGAPFVGLARVEERERHRAEEIAKLYTIDDGKVRSQC